MGLVYWEKRNVPKCVRNASKFIGKRGTFQNASEMRQTCVKNACNTFGGEHLLDDTENFCRGDLPALKFGSKLTLRTKWSSLLGSGKFRNCIISGISKPVVWGTRGPEPWIPVVFVISVVSVISRHSTPFFAVVLVVFVISFFFFKGDPHANHGFRNARLYNFSFQRALFGYVMHFLN